MATRPSLTKVAPWVARADLLPAPQATTIVIANDPKEDTRRTRWNRRMTVGCLPRLPKTTLMNSR